MSFTAPLWLIALLIVPVAVLALWRRGRRGERYVVRHPATATVRAALPAAPRWPRHVPTGLLLAAAALIVLALARPRVVHRVPTEQASLMLVSDHSGSMAAQDVKPTRLAAAISAANAFIDQVPGSVRVGAVTFSTVPDSVQGPTLVHADARRVIDDQQANGGTDTGAALELALRLLGGSRAGHPPAAIVLLSDGAANAGPNPLGVAETARREHIAIDTVALGTESGAVVPNGLGPAVSVPPDPQLMRQIASLSGGRAFDARTADELGSIYKSLGTELSTVVHHRDITFVFVIAGAVALLAAAGASLALGPRLP